MVNNRRDYAVTVKHKPIYEFVKRVGDVVLSLLALIVLSPLLLIVALIVKTDGGPAFFKQVRTGKNGKQFNLYKFRSMVVGADSPEMLEKLKQMNEVDGPAFKIKADPRITPVGRFIRKTSIDELPQLINIIRGDMSIVGPRPPLPSEVEHYDDYQLQRLLVKGGLTCYWQCGGRNDLSFDEWVELDLDYIERRSVLTDIGIIIKTVPAVITGRGAS